MAQKLMLKQRPVLKSLIRKLPARYVLSWSDIQLKDRLGAGSFGEVWRAHCLGGDVALKGTRLGGASDEALTRLVAEVTLISQLAHPNLVQFMGLSLCSPCVWMVLEFMPRGSVRDVVVAATSQKPGVSSMTWDVKLNLAMDTARGMHYLHTFEPPVLHRDLKGSNVLVGSGWRGKVGDFGLSRSHADTQVMSRCGSPAWVAPEVITDEPYGPSVDVYSFGVFLWELVMEQQPYEGEADVMSLLQRIAYSGYRPPLDVTRLPVPHPPQTMLLSLHSIMTACWAADPDTRPAFSTVLDALVAVSDNEPLPPLLPAAEALLRSTSSMPPVTPHEAEALSPLARPRTTPTDASMAAGTPTTAVTPGFRATDASMAGTPTTAVTPGFRATDASMAAGTPTAAAAPGSRVATAAVCTDVTMAATPTGGGGGGGGFVRTDIDTVALDTAPEGEGVVETKQSLPLPHDDDDGDGDEAAEDDLLPVSPTTAGVDGGSIGPQDAVSQLRPPKQSGSLSGGDGFGVTEVPLTIPCAVWHEEGYGTVRVRQTDLMEGPDGVAVHPDAGWITVHALDSTATALHSSPHCDTVVGMEPEDYVGGNVFEYMHPDDRVRVMGAYSTYLQNEFLLERRPAVIYRLRNKKTQEYAWVSTVITYVGDTHCSCVTHLAHPSEVGEQ